MAPLVSDVAIQPEPEIEVEAPAKQDLTEESSAVFTPEPETSYAIEVTPAVIDHSLVAESGRSDDENAVNQSETMELQSEIEPRTTEVEHTFSPVEDEPDVADDKTSESAPILAAAEENIQPQSTAVLVTEAVLDNGETITPPTELEGQGTAGNIEEMDVVVKEVDL